MRDSAEQDTADPDEVSDAVEAYTASRSEFIAHRKDMVARLKDADHAGRAARVKAFAKPSAAADALNRLVRHSPGLIDRIGELGRSFRAAQEHADRAAIRGLGSERNALLREVATAIAALPDGDPPSATAMDEVKQTVLAAIADARAAQALSSGRLVRSLASDGLSPVDLAGAVGGPQLPPAPEQSPSGPAAIDNSLARRRAKKELARAEAAASAAQRGAEEAEEDAVTAERRADRARAALREAEAEADRLRASADAARAEESDATRRRRSAQAELDQL